MTNNLNTIDNSEEVSSLTTEDILSTIDGIPLPPAIKKSLWKAIGRLITGLVDVPVAYLEAKAQQIKTEADALSLITKSAAEAASTEFRQDKLLIDRTVNHFGSRLLREQINREETVNKAIEDLKVDPPKEDSNIEIDADWLEMFAQIAEIKSNEEVQLVFAKILAGEIRKPGTFSPRTIQTLSLLDQKTANIFQSFCNISFEAPSLGESLTCVICEPFGSPGNNGLLPVGLSYSQLAELQDAGLIQRDLTAWREIGYVVFALPIKLGDTILSLYKPEEILTQSDLLSKMVRIDVINFTAVGLELRKVLQLSSNQIYNNKFSEWVKSKLNISQK